jgi:MFS family permease
VAPSATRDPLRSGIFLLLCLGYLATTAFEFLLPPVMPALSKDLGISFAQQGTLFLVVSVAEATSNLAAGWGIDRIGGRTIGTLALAVAAAGCALTAAWARYEVLLVAQALIGAGAGAFFSVAAPRVAALAGAAQRGRAFGIWGAAVGLGGLGSAGLAATMAERSWQGTYVVLAVVGAVLAVAFVASTVDNARVGRAQPGSLRAIVTPMFLRLTGLGMVATSAQVGVSAFLPAYAVDRLGYSVGSGAALLAGGRLLSLPAKVFAGASGDRFGRSRMLQFVMFAAVACMLSVLSQHRVLAGAGIVVYVAVAGSIFPLVNAIMGDSLPAERLGSGFGTFRAIQIAFGGLVALAIGVVSDLVGIRLSLTIGLAALLIGIALVRGLARTHVVTVEPSIAAP